MDAQQRRAAAKAERIAKTGIDEAMIANVVSTFYGRVRKHDVLGPVFEARVGNWDDHIARLCAFWSSVVLASGAYGGTPMQKHLPLPIDSRHFDMWLVLFEATLREICAPAQVQYFMIPALRIAESLEMAIAGHHGILPPVGERLRRPDADVHLPAD